MLTFKNFKKAQVSVEFLLCFLVMIAVVSAFALALKGSTEKFHDNYKNAFLGASAKNLELGYNEAIISSMSSMQNKENEIMGYDNKIFAKSGNEIFEIKTLNLERKNYA